MLNFPNKFKQIELSPIQFLAMSFILVIIIGTLLLSMPAASATGHSIGGVDAFFTATSAVCVTGLVVADTGMDFTTFGQVVILILIQIGGLGLMSVSTMIFLLLGKKITLKERLIIQQSLNESYLGGIVRLTRDIFIVTLIIEAVGALMLSLRFIPIFGWEKGVYYSIFHSVSAFCNAGFDLMGHYSSLINFAGDYLINITIMCLIIMGGIGFSVILDIKTHRMQVRAWYLHTKIVVLTTLILVFIGFVSILFAEYNNELTLGLRPVDEKIMTAMFQSVSARTAGMNSIDIGGLTDVSKFMLVILMFIGASPGSTGGGIKTTTFALILLTAISVIRGREDINVFKRRIPHSLAARALAISLISLLALALVTIALSMLEAVPFIDVLFQAASALGTVGLSTMDTGGMNNVSKILISLTMFMGRVGPLTLTLAFVRRQSRGEKRLRYPQEKIMLG